MKKIISYAVGVFLSTTIIPSHATTYYAYPGITIDVDFKSNETQTIKNPFFWKISLSCTLNSQKRIIPIEAKAVKKSATINNHVLKEGESIRHDLNVSDKLNIKADGSSQFSITNLSDVSASAKCKV
jgi:hypothetical protein